MSKKDRKIIIGIDEAGRGPLAGPVVVAAVAGIRHQDLLGIRDSKKLTAPRREEWYRVLRKKAICRYASASHVRIDKEGIARATKKAIARLLKNFPAVKPHLVLLDGSIYAPRRYRQRTLIRGDERVPLIAAASIIAKVTRDRKMMRLDKKYPAYGFALHKGYGTRAHFAAIKKHGLSHIHRKSFCKRFKTIRS